MRKNKKKGFTLVEAMIVVIIIGILASVAVPQYRKAVLRARAAEAIKVMGQIKEAEEIYYVENGVYIAALVMGGVGGNWDILGVAPNATPNKKFNYVVQLIAGGFIIVAFDDPFVAFINRIEMYNTGVIKGFGKYAGLY